MKKEIQIEKIKTNPSNPRLIKDEKFKNLIKSIKDFPEMLELRPIIVDENMIILGGNMRYRACLELGLKKVWINQAKNLSEKQKQEFIIKDNVQFGVWDWDNLGNEWDNVELGDWGMDVWQPEEEVDYSILDDADLSSELSDMTGGVKKAIQIEFQLEHYEEAAELVKHWRTQNVYLGGMILNHLKSEKEKS